MITSKVLLAAIYAICHGEAVCQTYVKDAQPATVSEVVMAYEALYGDRLVCK
jgi:hypothetical protein